MIKLLLEPVNFLILDEPTNHLDMRTKDILKDAIRDFEGTVIVVSHDRDFLDGLVEKVYEFGGGKVKENLGGIYDFLRARNLSALEDLQLSRRVETEASEETAPKAGCSEASPDLSPKEEARLSYAEMKNREKGLRKAERAVKAAEEKIASLEQEQADIETRIAGGDASPETLKDYENVKLSLDEAMSAWEMAQMELDSMNSNQ